jgi:hypothetical protein
MLECDRYETCVFRSNGIGGSRKPSWCILGMKQQHTIFHTQGARGGGGDAVSRKSASGHIALNLCFASGVI